MTGGSGSRPSGRTEPVPSDTLNRTPVQMCLWTGVQFCRTMRRAGTIRCRSGGRMRHVEETAPSRAVRHRQRGLRDGRAASSTTRTSSWSASTATRRTRSDVTPGRSSASTRSGSSPPATSRTCSGLQPDVVNFNGVWPDVDMFCALLEHGINVVTTSDWITGHHRDRNHPHPSGSKPTELVEAACQRGGTTFYGTGMNPGLAQILSVVATAGMGRVDHVTVLETVDVSCHHSVDTWKNVGYGRPGGRSRDPRPARDGLHGLRRLDLPDGGLPRPAHRRRRLRVRARRLHRGRRPRLVDAAQGVGRRQPGQVQGDVRRRAEDRGPPRMADDAEDRADVERPGLLHHHHRGRPR